MGNHKREVQYRRYCFTSENLSRISTPSMSSLKPGTPFSILARASGVQMLTIDTSSIAVKSINLGRINRSLVPDSVTMLIFCSLGSGAASMVSRMSLLSPPENPSNDRMNNSSSCTCEKHRERSVMTADLVLMERTMLRYSKRGT